jgi:NitT/TauT family transport system permease protein
MPAEQTVDLARTADAPTQAAEAAQAGEAAQAAEAQALAGLDNLDSYEVVRTPLWKRSLKAAYPPVLAVVIIIAVWQAFYASDTLPAPIDVWHAITGFDHRGLLWPAIFGSLHYGALGFLIAAAIGTPLGLALGRIPWLRAGIGPIVTGLQNLPSVAWVPVAIIWFHLSPGTKFFVVIIGATPSIANGMVSGLDQVPPIFLRVGHVLGARGLTLARHVLLPAVLPAYIGGLRQGWAFAWRSLMAAEIIAASLGHGLGQLLSQAQDTASISQGLAVIVLILVVGIAVEVLIFRPLERTVLRRRGLALAR